MVQKWGIRLSEMVQNGYFGHSNKKVTDHNDMHACQVPRPWSVPSAPTILSCLSIKLIRFVQQIPTMYYKININKFIHLNLHFLII